MMRERWKGWNQPVLIPVRWDDVQLVNEGFEAARDAIVARLANLLDPAAEHSV